MPFSLYCHFGATADALKKNSASALSKQIIVFLKGKLHRANQKKSLSGGSLLASFFSISSDKRRLFKV